MVDTRDFEVDKILYSVSSFLFFLTIYNKKKYFIMRKKLQRTKEEYEEAIKSSYSIAESLRKLGIKDKGGNYRIIKNAIQKYNIDTSHFRGQGWNVGLKFIPSPKQDIKNILVRNSSYQSYKLKKRLLEEGIKEYKCEECGFTEWKGQKIPLELHHINGDNTDNRIENIQLLCPNCHALTDNYRGKKRKRVL